MTYTIIDIPEGFSFPRKGGGASADLTLGGFLACLSAQDQIDLRSIMLEGGLTAGDGCASLIGTSAALFAKSRIFCGFNEYLQAAEKLADETPNGADVPQDEVPWVGEESTDE